MTTMLVGEYGMAEPMPVADSPAILGRWVVTSKLWHPTYNQFVITLITLRDHGLPVPSAVVAVPGATHAVASLTVNPNHPWTDGPGVAWLVPVNLEAQFAARDDQHALRVLERCAAGVIDGALNPESGARPNLSLDEWYQYLLGAVAST